MKTLFIEFGSLATEVFEFTSNGEKKSKLGIEHPFNIVSIDNTINLESYKNVIMKKLQDHFEYNGFKYNRIKGYATGIYRNSKNKKEVLYMLSSLKQLEVSVLSPIEESIHSYNSFIHRLNVQLTSKVIYVDIGGGSTEISRFNNHILQDCISLPVGMLHIFNHLFTKNETIDLGLQRLQKYFEHYLDQYNFFFEQVLGNNTLNHYDVIVTGSAAKKIPKKYLTDKGMHMSEFREYLSNLEKKFKNIHTTHHLRRQVKRTTFRKKLVGFLGCFFFYFICNRLKNSHFYVNYFGLSRSLNNL